jgi:hypothetical protein
MSIIVVDLVKKLYYTLSINEQAKDKGEKEALT